MWTPQDAPSEQETEPGRLLLERHLAATGTAVTGHGGEMIKSIGDGVLALFTGPAQGVRCAGEIITDAGELSIDVRTGLHTGEVERTGDDVAGLAVHLAARITSLADAGEILVSRTVRDLVIGSELTFTGRGEHHLKGIPRPLAPLCRVRLNSAVAAYCGPRRAGGSAARERGVLSVDCYSLQPTRGGRASRWSRLGRVAPDEQGASGDSRSAPASLLHPDKAAATR